MVKYPEVRVSNLTSDVRVRPRSSLTAVMQSADSGARESPSRLKDIDAASRTRGSGLASGGIVNRSARVRGSSGAGGLHAAGRLDDRAQMKGIHRAPIEGASGDRCHGSSGGLSTGCPPLTQARNGKQKNEKIKCP